MKITKEELLFRQINIVHCAFELFCSKGIEEVTMEEISWKANVGVTSIYRYFRTKSVLLHHTYKLLWQKIAKEFTAVQQTEGFQQKNGFLQLSCLINGFEALLKDHQEYLIFSANYKLYHVRESLHKSDFDYDKALDPICTFFMDAIRKGMRDGSVQSIESPKKKFSYLWSILLGIAESTAVENVVFNQPKEGKERFHCLCIYLLHEFLYDEIKEKK